MPFVRTQPEPPKGQPQRDMQECLSGLDDADPACRREAALALAEYGQALPRLCARLSDEPDIAVREAVITAMVRIGGEDSVACLIPFLSSEDAGLRMDATEAIRQLGDIAKPHLRKLLEDPDPDVRILAVNVLQSVRPPEGPRWLVEVIERDDHVNVCAAAVEALAEAGGPDAVPALERLRARFLHVPFMRFAVDTALGRVAGG